MFGDFREDLLCKTLARIMVPAYDDPVIWEGHSSMITEISRQLSRKPDAICVSVGGGGLLGGLIVGCKNVGWDDGEQNKNHICGRLWIDLAFSADRGSRNHRLK